MSAKTKFYHPRSGGLTEDQTKFYWNLWKRVCAEHGWKQADNEKRYALHARARCPQSMKDFTNDSFDKFKGLCLHLLGEKSGNNETGPRTRLIWRIKNDARLAGQSDDYIRKIATDLTGLGCWEDLSLEDLTNLRNTIHNRAGKSLECDTRTRHTPRRKIILTPEKTFTPKPAPATELATTSSDAEPF